MRIRAREWLAVGIAAGSVGLALIRAIGDDSISIASQTRALIRVDADDLTRSWQVPREAAASLEDARANLRFPR